MLVYCGLGFDGYWCLDVFWKANTACLGVSGCEMKGVGLLFLGFAGVGPCAFCFLRVLESVGEHYLLFCCSGFPTCSWSIGVVSTDIIQLAVLQWCWANP